MASDNIREVGKFVKQTRRDTDYALKRYHSKIPLVERTRDIFDSEIPFKMNFETKRKGNKVLLDLNFNKPPPLNRCKSDCLAATCESFVVEPGIDHLLTLQQPYIAGTTTVFINYSQVLPSTFDEVSPESGQIFVQGTTTSTLITVCYSYGNCDSDFEDCINIGTGAYTGLAVVFSDRFDRTTPIENPAGGCGEWDFSAFGDPVVTDNAAAIRSGLIFLGEPLSDNFEALFAVKGLGPGGKWAISLGSPSFPVAASYGFIAGQLTMSSTYMYTNATNSFTFWEGGIVSKAFVDHTTEDFYIRFASVPGSGAFIRIWPQSEPEPAGGLFGVWSFQISPFNAPILPSGPGPQQDAIFDEQVFPALGIIGVTMDDGVALQAISVWGQGGMGRSNMPAIDEFPGSYRINSCTVNPDGLLRQGHCSSTTITVTEASAIQEMDNSNPHCAVGLSYEITVGSPPTPTGRHLNSSQHTRIFKFPENDPNYPVPSQVRLTGEVQTLNFLGVGFEVGFYSLGGPGEPGQAGFFFAGSLVGTASGGNGNTWNSFDITLPVIDGVVHYTVGFLGGVDAVEAALGSETENRDSNEGAIIDLRFVKVYSISPLTCSTHPYCPDSLERYNERNEIEEEL
jgi:hypothetical protein